MDTVFAESSLFNSWREDEDNVYGPGVIDMKGRTPFLKNGTLRIRSWKLSPPMGGLVEAVVLEFLAFSEAIKVRDDPSIFVPVHGVETHKGFQTFAR
ncbi:MAG: hypothetical protein JEZ11_12095 [Desulfobacterales bacterium]|nr:hypothetical protein [Desulfobacterales bacterium]